MPNVLIRGMAEQEIRTIKKEAERQHRSMNDQVLVIIEWWLESEKGVKFR